MATIGRIAGVSQVTVSRALSDPAKVSPATLARIREAIDMTGYLPNGLAGALASRRSHLVAAIVPSITNIVYSSFTRHFSERIRGLGYQVLLAETGFSPAEEEALLAAILTRRPDGVLMTGVHHSAQCRRLLLGAGVPVVEVWDITDTPIDVCVGFSHRRAGEAMADFVLQRGYRRAAIVSAGDERARQRKEAFTHRLEVAGVAPVLDIVFDEEASIAHGRQALARLLEGGFRHGVIGCSSDLLAHGLLIEAQTRGLAIPADIAVIGFGDQSFAAHTFPAMTTIRVDQLQLGHRAADMLLARINGHASSVRALDIGFEVIARESA